MQYAPPNTNSAASAPDAHEASRAEELEAAVRGYADRELAQLTEAQRAAVVAVAGSDPSRILRTVEQLRPTWATPAATDHKAHFAKLRQTNPFAAAAYAERHFREII